MVNHPYLPIDLKAVQTLPAFIKATTRRLNRLESEGYTLEQRVKVLEEAYIPSTAFKKPTVMELWQYATSRNYMEFDPDKFIAHYDSNGWKVGKVHMKDWRGCVRTWHQHEKERQRKAAIK